MTKVAVSVENQKGVRSLTELIDDIPQRFFARRGTFEIPELARNCEEGLIVIKTFTDFTARSKENAIFRPGTQFAATGNARCLKPNYKLKNSKLCELEVIHKEKKTKHWIACSCLKFDSVLTTVSEEVIEKEAFSDMPKMPPPKSKKVRKTLRHQGARHVKNGGCFAPSH